MYDANTILQASGALTASGNSAAMSLPSGTPRRGLRARCLVTAVSGTSPTMQLKIQDSPDNSTWSDRFLGDVLTAVGETYLKVDTDQPYVRAAWVIGGTTPSFTTEIDLGMNVKP